MALKQMCCRTGNTLFLRCVRVFLRPEILQTGAVKGLITMFTYCVELQHTAVHGFRYPQSRGRKMNAGIGGWDQCVHISCIKDRRMAHTQLVCHSEGPGEIKRREVVLDPQVSPEEIMSREVELGCESWTFLASSCHSTALQRTLSF